MGWLSPQTGTVRAVSSKAGVVAELLVSEGAVVERHAPLARISMLDGSSHDSSAAVLSRTLAAQGRAHVDGLEATIRRFDLEAERLEERRSSLRREVESIGKQMPSKPTACRSRRRISARPLSWLATDIFPGPTGTLLRPP